MPALRRKRGDDIDTVVYQQVEATLHCTNALLKYLHRYFPGDRLISHRTDYLWPVHS